MSFCNLLIFFTYYKARWPIFKFCTIHFSSHMMLHPLLLSISQLSILQR